MKTGELYDLLQESFGIGPADESLPWYRARAIEIAKLNRMLTSRHCTAEEVAAAAAYAKEQHRPILAAWQVFELVPEARHAQRVDRQRVEVEALHENVIGAIREALKAGETEWADRLTRTPDTHVESVLQEWRNRS